MSDCYTNISAQIEQIDKELEAINAAILATINGDHAEYQLDSGQSSQRVKRLSLKDLRELRDALTEDRQRLINECAGPTIAIPGY